MSGRSPRLAVVIADHIGDVADTLSSDDAGRHIAAVWREACTIRTVAQLDALPVGSVVMPLWYLNAGPCWKLSDGWFGVFVDKPMHPLGSRREGNSALLIWHPEWEA